MNGFAVFTENKEGRLTGYGSYFSTERNYMGILRCYPHRDSNIQEGVVLIESEDQYSVKVDKKGDKYMFVKGENIKTETFHDIDIMEIKRSLFYSVFKDFQATPTNMDHSLLEYEVGGNTVYAGTHSLYVVVANKLYVMGDSYEFIKHFLKRLQFSGVYTMTDEVQNGMTFFDKVFQATGDPMGTRQLLDIDEKATIPNLLPMVVSSGLINSMHSNSLLQGWLRDREEMLPLGVSNAIVYMLRDTNWGPLRLGEVREELRNILQQNPEKLFEQLLALEEISEKKIEKLVKALESRVKDKNERRSVLYGFKVYIGGYQTYEKALRGIMQ